MRNPPGAGAATQRGTRVGRDVLLAAALALLGAQAVGHSGDRHAGHQRQVSAAGNYRTRTVAYHAPAVKLVDQTGQPVRIDRLLSGDRPVLMQFIFTTCTTICPVMGATFSQAQAELLAADPRTVLVSISIDPEHDSPARLSEFARRFDAGSNWRLLTGSAADVRTVMKAFDVLYAGDNKMYHQFNTFLRIPQQEEWVRFDGMPGARQLVAEYRAALAPR